MLNLYKKGVNEVLIKKDNKIIFNTVNPVKSFKKIKKNTHIHDLSNPEYHPYYRNTKLHTIQSITKSIMSLLFGVAIQRGDMKISIVNKLIKQYFPEYKKYFVNDPNKQQIKVKHLLTMTSGFCWHHGKGYFDPKNTSILMELSDDWIKFILDRKIKYKPGTRFEYQDCNTVLLGYIFKKVTSFDLDVYAKKYLFSILKIKSFYWKKIPDRSSDPEGGLYLSMESLFKIGELVMNNGKYNNKQVVSKNWIKKSIKDYKPTKEYFGYGYQWWLRDDAIFGWGFNGQYLFILPKKKIIAVIYQWNNKNEIEPYYFYNYLLKQ